MSLQKNRPFPYVQPDVNPEIPIVASDLEGTMTSGVTLLGVHAFLNAHGRGSISRRISRRRKAQYLLRKLLGFKLRDFKNDWMREALGVFEGEHLAELQHMAAWVVRRVTWKKRRTVVVDELRTHLSEGRRVILVTGLPDLFLRNLLEHLEGMEAIGTAIRSDGERFSGVLMPFNVGANKVRNLQRVLSSQGRLHSAYGDTISDQAMLALAERPIAVHPDRGLKAVARSAAWRIIDA